MEGASDGGGSGTRQALSDGEKKVQRERDNLRLSRAYVQHQIESSTNERYTESLRKALSEIDQRLAKMGNAG